MTKYMPYAGIGSRSAPLEILGIMTQMAAQLEEHGFTLRSGGAEGCDHAFEIGVNNPSNKEIYLPWQGFNAKQSTFSGASVEAMNIAGRFHPAWKKLPRTVKIFHGRNAYQVLGIGLDHPARFIICWTPDGGIVGGTGQALRMAKHYNVPVFNLGSLTSEQVGEGINEIMNQGE